MSITKGSKIRPAFASLSCCSHSCLCGSETVESKSVKVSIAAANDFRVAFSFLLREFAARSFNTCSKMESEDSHLLILIIFMKFESFI